jgi:hypothetical protein
VRCNHTPGLRHAHPPHFPIYAHEPARPALCDTKSALSARPLEGDGKEIAIFVFVVGPTHAVEGVGMAGDGRCDLTRERTCRVDSGWRGIGSFVGVI